MSTVQHAGARIAAAEPFSINDLTAGRLDGMARLAGDRGVTNTRAEDPSAQTTRRGRSRKVAVDLLCLMDLIAVGLGMCLPAWIYATYGGLRLEPLALAQAAILAAIVVNTVLRSSSVYDTRLLHDLPVRPGVLLAALVLALIAVLGLGTGLRDTGHVWVWYASWLSASFTLVFANHIAARALFAAMTARGAFDVRVAVFGAGRIARKMRDHFALHPSGFQLVGVYDDRAGANPGERLDAEGLWLDGTLEDLIAAGRNGAVDQIVIALPPAADQRTAEIVRRLEQLPVSMHVVSHVASEVIGEGPAVQAALGVSSLGPVGLIDIKAKPLADWAPFQKRLLDIVAAGMLIIVALPVMAIVALAVKLDSKGPALFRQRRNGLNKHTFEVLKFRSMHVMENGAQVAQAKRVDARVTRIGWFLRRSSLDELPQLFNVLRGDMSLVGPRPHALVHDETWGEMLEAYANRHQVKPGITGLAQVRGFRGEASSRAAIEGRVACDLEYIAKWSIWLDLWILQRTAWAVLTGRNAH